LLKKSSRRIELLQIDSYCLFGLILIFFVFPISLPAQTVITPPSVDEWDVLTLSNFPPYSSLDKNQQLQGFAIDIFNSIAERAGINFSYLPEPDRSSIIDAIDQRKGDILLNIGHQQDVEQWLDFTTRVAEIPVSVFVRENASIFSLKDLKADKVAMVSGPYSGSEILPPEFPADIKIEQFDRIELAFYALMSGQVDALIYLQPVVWNVAINLQLSDKVRNLTPPLNVLGFSIGIRKNQQDLIQRIELATRSLEGSERYNTIYNHWFKHDVPFWNTRSVFWSMSALIILLLLITQWFRSRELIAVNETLQQQIDDATLQLSENNAYLKDLTVTDTLTGINNRRAFENNLSELITRSSRYHEIFSMLIFDIDDFKKLNDQYGHDVGDTVLVELVDRVQSIVRDVDTLCRWGGEEFTILMPQTSQEGALKMAERCRSVVADTPFDEVGQVTISLGVTCYRPKDNERKLFKRADDALYQAKSQGKDCVVWNDEDVF
jgi:diguanylate cyclase (GGDEF)-like protein